MRILEIADGGTRLTEAPTPLPGAGQVLIQVAASGINRADLLQIAGHYPPPPGEPEHPGLEVAGTIATLGADVEGWQIGDRVSALLAGGGHADYALAHASLLLRTPDVLTDVEAATLPEALATAWSTLVGFGAEVIGGLTPGDDVLILGGSGGVGTLAVQIATTAGGRVITTAGGPEKVAALAGLGAAVVLDHRALSPADLTAAVLAATDGRGADVIFDVLGGGALAENVNRLAMKGRLLLIGTQAGSRGELDVLALMQRRASIHGTTLRSRPLAEKAAIMLDVTRHVMRHVEAGRIRPVLQETFPAEQASDAFDRMRAGSGMGKLVITW